jgi:hypothetical protein
MLQAAARAATQQATNQRDQIYHEARGAFQKAVGTEEDARAALAVRAALLAASGDSN